MAGQSNMAGRDKVKTIDTATDYRIYCVDKWNKIQLAKEPLHKYEPGTAGYDCGISFAKEIIHYNNDSIKIILIPAAVGGSSIDQWLADSVHRNISLFSNLLEKLDIASKFGVLKGMIWLQGEEDAMNNKSAGYEQKLLLFFKQIREATESPDLAIVSGKLPIFKKGYHWEQISSAIENTKTLLDKYSVIDNHGLTHLGDSLHYDSESQKIIGQRFAREMILLLKRNSNNGPFESY